jgi:hypothetical protein
MAPHSTCGTLTRADPSSVGNSSVRQFELVKFATDFAAQLHFGIRWQRPFIAQICLETTVELLSGRLTPKDYLAHRHFPPSQIRVGGNLQNFSIHRIDINHKTNGLCRRGSGCVRPLKRLRDTPFWSNKEQCSLSALGPLTQDNGLCCAASGMIRSRYSPPNNQLALRSHRQDAQAPVLPVTAEGASVILVLNQYICIGCSPGRHPDIRTLATDSDDDSRDSVHDRYLCIAV